MIRSGNTRSLLNRAQSMLLGSARTKPLSAINAAAVWDLDATIADSYDGTSEYVNNLIVNPDDGSAQTAYRVTLGLDNTVSTDNPTFIGTANDPAAYFALDGGDFFRLASGTNTAFINNFHKSTGDNYTLVFVLWFEGDLQYFMGTASTLASTSGMVLYKGADAFGFAALRQLHNGGSNDAFSGNGVLPTGEYVLFGVGVNKSANQITFWSNSATGATGAYTLATETDDADGVMRLCAGVVSAEMANGGRFVHSSAFNKLLDNTEMAEIKDQLELRHERLY